MTDYQKVAGSAVGAETVASIRLKSTNIDDEKISSRFEEIGELDTVNSTKYPKADNSVAYLAGGTFSIAKDDGKFVISNNSDRPSPGIIRGDQEKSTFVSTATEMKIGSETIKTLTGLLMNPSLVIRPSSNITPEKTWIQSLFPILTDNDYRVIFMYRLIQASMFSILKKLDDSRTGKKTYEQHKSYKDLGTIVIENQDFENKILNNSIKK